MKSKKSTSVRLDEDVAAALEALKAGTDLNVSKLVNETLRRPLGLLPPPTEIEKLYDGSRNMSK